MAKLIINKDSTTVSLREGRKNAWKVENTKLTAEALAGVVAAQDPDTITQDGMQAAIDEAARRRGSIINDDYRCQYGVDQNCGDEVAAKLKSLTTGKDGKADMAAVENIAGQNGMADDYDRWMTRGLNNGMVRMNLGNKLRSKVRHGGTIVL